VSLRVDRSGDLSGSSYRPRSDDAPARCRHRSLDPSIYILRLDRGVASRVRPRWHLLRYTVGLHRIARGICDRVWGFARCAPIRKGDGTRPLLTGYQIVRRLFSGGNDTVLHYHAGVPAMPFRVVRPFDHICPVRRCRIHATRVIGSVRDASLDRFAEGFLSRIIRVNV
jgi:hypothetical protein